MKLALESELQQLGRAFAAQGVTLYAVGGFVRDRLLGRAVYDLRRRSRWRPSARGIPA